jgi:hypothetical protein
MFFLQQNRRIIEQNRFCLEVEVGGRVSEEVAQMMYTCISKYKNDKRKKKNYTFYELKL